MVTMRDKTFLITTLSLALLAAASVARAESAPIPPCFCNEECEYHGYDVCLNGYCYYGGDPTIDGTPCAPCQAPLSECSGACFDLTADERHCGGCDQACPSSSYTPYECVAGTCTCSETVCGSDCVPLDRDPENCGACGVRCAENETCHRGSCICDTTSVNRALCAGECVDPYWDPGNCGACGLVCGAGEICSSGTCTTDPWSLDAGPTPGPSASTDAGPVVMVNDVGPPSAQIDEALPLQNSGCSLSAPSLGLSLFLLLPALALLRRRRAR